MRAWRKAASRGFLLLSVSLLPAVLTADEGRVVRSMTPYDDPHGIVSNLATENALPFRLNGKTVANKYVKRQYGQSVSKFPTVRPCLTKEASVADRPDLSAIDWSKMDSTRDADVCLFRIASSYSEIDAFDSWLRFHQFDVSPRRLRKAVRPHTAYIRVEAHRSTRRYGALFNTGFFQIIPFLDLRTDFVVIAHYSTGGKFIGVHTAFNTK